MALDVFIVPDGARTWIGAGGDPALVAAKLQLAVSGTGDNLRGRSELASMRDATVGSAGFVTERALPEVAQMIQVFSGDADIAGGADIFDEIAQLPHQGVAAIPFTQTPSANPTGTVVGTLQVPRATVDDVVVSILKHGI
jgi:hypothetical protein